jgi:hypothetical protein
VRRAFPKEREKEKEMESILGLRRGESAVRLETRLRGVLDDYCATLRGVTARCD